jgi:hypothetical protein
MKITKRISLFGAILALGITTTQVQAAMYTVGYGGLDGGWALGIGAQGASAPTPSGSHLVGGILMTPDAGQKINTVCTDISAVLYLGSSLDFIAVPFEGQTGYNPNWGYTAGDGANAIQNAAWLFDKFKSALTLDNTVTTDKTALQLAVWEVLYDTGNTYSITGGRFQASGTQAVMDRAAVMLSALPRQQNYVGYLLQPANAANQEVFFGVTPVPEPTTMIAGALLLLPFGASTLRFLRKNRTA